MRNQLEELRKQKGIRQEELAAVQEALKDLLGGTIKEMMETAMEDHLGYNKSQRSDNDDSRNGYKTKQVNSSLCMQAVITEVKIGLLGNLFL